MSMMMKISQAKALEYGFHGRTPNFVLIHPTDVAILLEEVERRIPTWPPIQPDKVDGMIIIKAEIPALLGNPKAIEIKEEG